MGKAKIDLRSVSNSCSFSALRLERSPILDISSGFDCTLCILSFVFVFKAVCNIVGVLHKR